jgi:opacity protein-like surface antigen
MRRANKLMLAAVLAVALPTGALAAEADLQVKIDKLTQQMEDLKGQVERIEDKSLGKWLQIGGSYQFRIDSLHGKTAAYTDAIGTMNNLVGGMVAGPNAVAGTTTFNSIVSGPRTFTTPNATQFMFMGKAGSLFTPDQFNTILTQYMPQAMYQAFFMPGGIAQTIGGMSQAQVNGALAQMAAITTKQQFDLTNPNNPSILNTLSAKVMPLVMSKMTVAEQTAFGSMPADRQALAMLMALQGFLGVGSGNLDQVNAYKPKNETLYTNKFSLDLKAKATKDVTVNVKLGMYKVFGSQDNTATANGDFADRVGVFDGVLGHVPSSSFLNVDRAYATWSNIMDQPVWFSVGRRPATDGAPTNLKANNERPGNGGTPALLVNYAFDGMTLGYAPDIEMLPGFYAKVCYGRGFDSGYVATPTNSLKDTDMLGVAIIPIDTDPLRVWFQWNRGFNIFDFPVMNNTIFGNTAPATSLGNIDWFGLGAMSTLKKVGPGDLNFFVDSGMSVTRPNTNVSNNAGFQGLMSGQFFAQDFNPSEHTGYAVFAGLRYDLPTKTKIGFEYNYGSKYWITFAPAADDMWTSKVGTRGQVFEPYIIQELNLKPISSVFAKTFFKIGYQYYDFQYTGSNNWVGAPVKISDIKPTDLMLMAPVKSAQNIYGTFEVHF